MNIFLEIVEQMNFVGPKAFYDNTADNETNLTLKIRYICDVYNFTGTMTMRYEPLGSLLF